MKENKTMPNWCRNQITIQSKDKKLIEGINNDLEDMNGKGLLHYMYPMPLELRDTTKGSNSETNQEFIDKYGFATVAAAAMGWFIYFIYTFITTEVKIKLGEANGVLIGLIDRIRMLDNDLIRLRSKLNTVLEMQENEKEKQHGNSDNIKDNNLPLDRRRPSSNRKDGNTKE